MSYPQFPGYPFPPQQPGQQFPPPYPQAPAPQPYPQAPQQPVAQPVAGSLDEYLNQPTGGGGKVVSWKDRPLGYTVVGVVAREITNADVRQATDYRTKQPVTFGDGRPKFELWLPLEVQPSPEFEEGRATIVVRGQLKDEVTRAVQAAGVASGVPEAGGALSITLSERRQIPNFPIPQNVFVVQYQRPANAPEATPAPAPATPVQQETPAPVATPEPPADLGARQAELLAQLKAKANQ